MKIVIMLMCCIAVGVALYAFNNAEVVTKKNEYPIDVSPITQEWVEREEGRALRVTYGEVVLEIPEKHKPNELTKSTKSIIFHLVWPGLTPTRETDKDKYVFTIMIYPKSPLSNYDQKGNVDWLLTNNYYLRKSIDYPSLLEYWSDDRKQSYYFIADYMSTIMNKIMGCSPGFREGILIKEKSHIKMGDTSCSFYGVISDSVVVRVRFDARLLHNGKKFHQSIDQLISSFMTQSK